MVNERWKGANFNCATWRSWYVTRSTDGSVWVVGRYLVHSWSNWHRPGTDGVWFLSNFVVVGIRTTTKLIMTRLMSRTPRWLIIAEQTSFFFVCNDGLLGQTQVNERWKGASFNCVTWHSWDVAVSTDGSVGVVGRYFTSSWSNWHRPWTEGVWL